MSKVYIFLAGGFEETEAIAPVDMLRRAKIEVEMISVSGMIFVKSSHNVSIEADEIFENKDFSDGSMIILPGGMPGTRNLQKHNALKELIRTYSNQGKFLAAICAAPLVYGSLGLLKGKSAICYPGFEQELEGAILSSEKVTVDGNIITACSAASAIDFGLKLVEMLKGKDVAESVAKAIVLQP